MHRPIKAQGVSPLVAARLFYERILKAIKMRSKMNQSDLGSGNSQAFEKRLSFVNRSNRQLSPTNHR
jgi:hypothetical protein